MKDVRPSDCCVTTYAALGQKRLETLLYGLWHANPLFFKKRSIWHELYSKKYFFAITNSGCNGWATELCNNRNRYLVPYKRLVVCPYCKNSRWLMHYPYVMYEHRSLSSLCIGLSGYRVWSCCVPDKPCGVVVNHVEGVTMVLLFYVFSNSVQLLETKVIVIWSIFIANYNYNYTRIRSLHYNYNYSKICN